MINTKTVYDINDWMTGMAALWNNSAVITLLYKTCSQTGEWVIRLPGVVEASGLSLVSKNLGAIEVT